MQSTPYLCDWLTLRVSLQELENYGLRARLSECLNTLTNINSDGEILWEKKVLDVDALRSDTVGLYWAVQGDGKQEYLVIGGSPASLEHGLNVFGSLDIVHCANVLIKAASKELKTLLPAFQRWQCRRIDITGNFVLPDVASVKQALRQLCLADGGRRKGSKIDRGGDSVYWNATSDLAKGKAYHKGAQLRMLVKKGRIEATEELLNMADRLLRLEHTRGARWFRRLAEGGRNWFDLKVSELSDLFTDFFSRVVEGVEVKDMDRHSLVALIAASNGITEGRAAAAFTTYRNIRADGFDVVKDFMPKATWYLHLKYLRSAGISDADMQMGNVVQFRPVRIVLAQPVTSWEEIRRAA